jgi:DNA-binding response OmpR family regulator
MAGLRKILLVDDDDDLREALSEQLVMTEDFDVFEAGTGADGMEKVKAGLFDLVILDVGLPDTDGRELCRRMRKQGVKCPILMLTGHDTDSDTILGLDAGANDYVTKPFKFPVLLARIRAQLRTHEQSEDAVFQLGPYTFKPAQKMLVDEKDKKIRLTEKETNILKYLYRSTSGVVARDVLLHEVWGYNAGVTTHTLETHIYRLRQKIEPIPRTRGFSSPKAGGIDSSLRQVFASGKGRLRPPCNKHEILRLRAYCCRNRLLPFSHALVVHTVPLVASGLWRGILPVGPGRASCPAFFSALQRYR